MFWVKVLLALLAAALLSGCVDRPDWVQLTNDSDATGDATLRFRAQDGVIVHTRPLTLGNASVERFMVELTSDIRYTAELVIGERLLTSEPFHTGLGDWRVYLTATDTALRVSTLHAD